MAKKLLLDDPEFCEVLNEDRSRVDQVAPQMPADAVFEDTARLLKAAGDPVRAKILFALGKTELCVCEVAELLGMSTPAVSHHLRILRDARLIRSRKEGKLVFHFLDETTVNGTVQELVAHLTRRTR